MGRSRCARLISAAKKVRVARLQLCGAHDSLKKIRPSYPMSDDATEATKDLATELRWLAEDYARFQAAVVNAIPKPEGQSLNTRR